jgi:hypothetical protein
VFLLWQRFERVQKRGSVTESTDRRRRDQIGKAGNRSTDAAHRQQTKAKCRVKETNFDSYLEEHLKDPAFAERFKRAGEAWDVALQNIAEMRTAYCPHCRAVTNLRVSVSPRMITKPDGEEEIIFSRTYHCEACHTFVRGEENPAISKLFL